MFITTSHFYYVVAFEEFHLTRYIMLALQITRNYNQILPYLHDLIAQIDWNPMKKAGQWRKQLDCAYHQLQFVQAEQENQTYTHLVGYLKQLNQVKNKYYVSTAISPIPSWPFSLDPIA